MQRGDLKDSRAVLRDYRQYVGGDGAVRGRAHAAAMKAQRTLLTALGPGFSAAFLMLDGR